jgi:predicted nucleic acid-binding protein
LSELFVFDTGALGALAQNDPRMRRLLWIIARDGAIVRIPSVVLAECYGNARHNAGYDRALKALGGMERAVVDVSATIAKIAGSVLRAAGSKETIDALVVATAVVLNPVATVVTADQRHVDRLAGCAPAPVGVIQLNQLPAS